MKATVINLDSRPDRWEQVQEQCALSGIVPIRLSATTVDDVHEGDVERFQLRAERLLKVEKKPEVWAATLACLRSHRRALQEKLSGGPSLILEDDVQLEPDVLAYLRRSEDEATAAGLDLGAVALGPWHRKPPVKFTANTVVCRRVWQAHAVWWTDRGAIDMERLLSREAMPVDEQWDSLAVRGRIVSPAASVAWHGRGWSDIQGRKTNHLFTGEKSRRTW